MPTPAEILASMPSQKAAWDYTTKYGYAHVHMSKDMARMLYHANVDLKQVAVIRGIDFFRYVPRKIHPELYVLQAIWHRGFWQRGADYNEAAGTERSTNFNRETLLNVAAVTFMHGMPVDLADSNGKSMLGILPPDIIPWASSMMLLHDIPRVIVQHDGRRLCVIEGKNRYVVDNELDAAGISTRPMHDHHERMEREHPDDVWKPVFRQ